MTRSNATIRNLRDIEREATRHGFGEQFHQALALADRRALGAMPHVRSLMLTPGCNHTRVLANVEFVGERTARVYVGGRNLEWYFGINDSQLRLRRLQSGGTDRVDPATLSLMLGQIDGMIAGQVENDAAPPPATELILDVLTSSRRPMTSDEIADRAGLWPRETGKVLSRLLSSSCPQRHRGKLARVEPGLFVAA